MKIVLITGMSGVGKTTIAQNLCERYPNKFNFVFSYTDRPLRAKNEWGHTFIESAYMDLLLERGDIIAKSQIEEYRYCSIASQFDDEKINLYIVDVDGINDTISSFPNADIMIVLVRKNQIEAECVRINRDVCVPAREDVDFIIDNDGKIELSANLLHTLINYDFFNKPSHIVHTLNDKLEEVHQQYRLLDKIKTSLYEQLWYQEKSAYDKLCKNVETQINNDFECNIVITPDSYPEICDGYLTFNIQAVYDGDLSWDEINRMTERLSTYSLKYCKEHDLSDISYRLAISEQWIGEKDYL